MPVPCLRDDSPRDADMGISEESALFLHAIGLAEARGFDWLQIKPEDRGDWARRVLAWEGKHGSAKR